NERVRTEANPESQPPLSEQLLIPLPPPPKPTTLLSTTQPPSPSAVVPSGRRQSASARKAPVSDVSDASGSNTANMADQILDWISGRHPQQQQQQDKNKIEYQENIDSAWRGAEGLMGGGPNMHIHIGEIATRLCSVIAAHEDAGPKETNARSDRQDRDQAEAANMEENCSNDALLSLVQCKRQHVSKSRINDSQQIWDAVWKNSNVIDKGDGELPFPQDNPNGDLVKAYLQLAEISSKK
ncbi:hypothetical protein IW138_002482, partial [Coemansia sp. RSA 986]